MANATETVYEGVPTSAEDNAAIDWGLEAWKKSLDKVGDSLRRIVTLDVALLGGSLAFLKDDVLGLPYRPIAMALFLVSLGVAFYGSLSRRETLPLDDPGAIRTFKDRLEAFRASCLTWATGALWAGFAVAIAGVTLRAIGG